MTTIGDVRGLTLEATDGEIGRVRDLLFDESGWSVRYVAADTGTWLPGRQVLLAPNAVEAIGDRVHVALSTRQVEESPPLSAGEPVSRRWEADVYGFYGYAPYWIQQPVWGFPVLGAPTAAGDPGEAADASGADPHLRSADEVTGYHVRATDDEIGHVEDLLLDDSSWSIPSIVVDTRNILPGKKVLLDSEEVDGISWGDQLVWARIPRDDIEGRRDYEG